MRTLTILAAGNVSPDGSAALSAHFDSILRIELPIPPGDAFEQHKPEVNRAIDASPPGWIFVMREGEAISDALAREISASACDSPVAWGFRIRTATYYCGRPLRLGNEGDGEIRLFHRRHCRFDLRNEGHELKVEGPVMRLREPLRRASYDSAASHRAALQQDLAPHSTLRRALLFARSALVTGAWKARWTTLLYLWIETGYDHGTRTRRAP